MSPIAVSTTVVGWVNPATDLGEWLDRPDEPDLSRYLQAAFEQCVEFLPHVDGVPVISEEPQQRLVLAQVLQARALYRSALAGSGDTIGADGMSVTVFPMDWTVKNLLRPRRVGRVL